jgi:site-specific recombinase XerD
MPRSLFFQHTPDVALAAEEFFKASIGDDTRRACGRLVAASPPGATILRWSCATSRRAERVTMSARREGSAPTRRSLRSKKFFGALVQRHVVAVNPLVSARGIKHCDGEGRTVELGIEQARKLFHSVDAGKIAGLRDRAPLGVLAYTGARVGAGRSCIGRLSEPLRTPGCCAASRRAVRIRYEHKRCLFAENSKSKAPLFRAADGERKVPHPAPYGPHLMRQVMKRRLEDAGPANLFSPHSFRITLVTYLFNQNAKTCSIWLSTPVRRRRAYDRRRT